MAAESPSAILVRAADLIRDTAAAATEGPWKWRDPGGHVKYALVSGDRTVVTSGIPDVYPSVSDGRWMELMSPAVAPMITAWLREASAAWAKAEESYRRDRSVINPSAGELSGHWGTWNLTLEERVSETDREALALARAVLGEKEEQ